MTSLRRSGHTAVMLWWRSGAKRNIENGENEAPPYEALQLPNMHVLNMRSYRNWLSSLFAHDMRIARTRERPTLWEHLVPVWKQQAGVFLRPTEGVIPCYFDRWIQAEEYRLALARRLDFTNHARTLDTVQSVSSFNPGVTSAKDIDPLSRYEWVLEHADPPLRDAVERYAHDAEALDLDAQIAAL